MWFHLPLAIVEWSTSQLRFIQAARGQSTWISRWVTKDALLLVALKLQIRASAISGSDAVKGVKEPSVPTMLFQKLTSSLASKLTTTIIHKNNKMFALTVRNEQIALFGSPSLSLY